jgi:hypothetical protein
MHTFRSGGTQAGQTEEAHTSDGDSPSRSGPVTFSTSGANGTGQASCCAFPRLLLKRWRAGACVGTKGFKAQRSRDMTSGKHRVDAARCRLVH